MINKIRLILIMFVLALPSTVLASHCPKDAKAIDHGLQSSKIDMSAAKDIKALRDKGMELHNAGKHREAEKALAEAMRKLLTAQ